MGLDEYGKGDWRSISRFYVMSKTPTQVASHAQKYFRRLESPTPLAKRRYSIHDTRIINSTIVESPARCGDPTTMAEELPPFYGPSNHLPTASTSYSYGDSFYGSSN
ncbi:hypothetical protein Nepgr_008458 [Nepenthes gracilis]|uniref:HTH myb-type domain-containing protein n=1 Tax=Nepenthes gracilis TaxID=150966 RepID=A0AAD3S8R5_NEPGR|nr:hypothetical protein Nepgr_008458 [Nepenthes gracilis]